MDRIYTAKKSTSKRSLIASDGLNHILKCDAGEIADLLVSAPSLFVTFSAFDPRVS